MDTVHSIGRRKTSIARIFINEGKGAIIVNKKKYTEEGDFSWMCAKKGKSDSNYYERVLILTLV